MQKSYTTMRHFKSHTNPLHAQPGMSHQGLSLPSLLMKSKKRYWCWSSLEKNSRSHAWHR